MRPYIDAHVYNMLSNMNYVQRMSVTNKMLNDRCIELDRQSRDLPAEDVKNASNALATEHV